MPPPKFMMVKSAVKLGLHETIKPRNGSAGVGVAVFAGTGVAVSVGVGVSVGGGVLVGVSVDVGVLVGVLVGILVGVLVGVGVSVSAGIQVPVAPKETDSKTEVEYWTVTEAFPAATKEIIWPFPNCRLCVTVVFAFGS